MANPQHEVLASWDAILKINYWPIFAIARDILGELQSSDAAQILRRLRDTAQEINSSGVENAHDLTGRIFQNLIADRKYLATFYTLPASAALLARLAVAKMEGVDWSDKETIGKLRIADFACGTGALLSAVYEQIAARHERTGGNPTELHKVMMEEVLYGCDVMPSAVHITCSTLSGMEPAEGFGKSRLYALQYGRQKDGSVKIGSLEFLQTSAQWTLFNTSDPAKQIGSSGEEIASQAIANIPDEGFDLVIMNPPFTSDTKHRDSGEGVLNAAFAAFNASEKDQAKMAKELNKFAKGTCYHGHAGLGSAFAGLANKKLKVGGVVAFVLPFTAINGSSWSKFRGLIASQYTDITIISIAANGQDMSFSSETGIAECLLVGRKIASTQKSGDRGNFISLQRRPQNIIEAQELFSSVGSNEATRRLEDGPYGGVLIRKGDLLIGEMLDAPIGGYKSGWGATRILDFSVAQVAYALSTSKLWLPAEPQYHELHITQLKNVGRRGVHHWQLIDPAMKGGFLKGPPSKTATYPCLWNHNAKNETRIICAPDSQMHVRPGMEADAARLWETASRAHVNLDFRFNSQPLTVAITEHPSVGGRAWPNVGFSDGRFDYTFALWCNCSLGLLLFWWHANPQVAGRAITTISSVPNMPVLDFRTLTDAQLAKAEMIFDEFRDKEFQPAYLADADPNRALLDRRVIRDLLGFDEEIYLGVRRLAAKWCAEPSVHGGKKRPPWAKFVA